MKLIIDSREQTPYTFASYECEWERGTLPVGDYAPVGMEDRCAAERKSLPDILNCLGKDRERFQKELVKARAYEHFIVVIEADFSTIRQGRFQSQINAHSALQTILTWQGRYKIPFVFAGNRANAEYVTFWSLQKYVWGIEKAFERMRKAQLQP